ncbi:MAG TPA: hypothetical protein VIL63_04720 [Terriglobales bacterium]
MERFLSPLVVGQGFLSLNVPERHAGLALGPCKQPLFFRFFDHSQALDPSLQAK